MTDTDTWFRFGFCSMLNIQHRPNRKTNTVLLFRGMFWCVDDVLRLFKLFSFTLVHLADLIFRFFTLWAFVDPATTRSYFLSHHADCPLDTVGKTHQEN